jgi:NDP-sugar pyrophosphorylase family protein
MKVLILLAGEGRRFRGTAYKEPKPMIPVHGKSILEWTLESAPIEHCNLHFALRADHIENNGILSWLDDKFGDYNYTLFHQTTGGNLETAYMASSDFDSDDEPLLILDGDNAYDHNDLDTKLKSIPAGDSMLITYFEPLDESIKWAFAILNNDGEVQSIVEKVPWALKVGGKPLIGTFWFSSIRLFRQIAKRILDVHSMVGEYYYQAEFYMSQAPNLFAQEGNTVYAHEVKNVVPLGTPEDIEKVKYDDTLQKISI